MGKRNQAYKSIFTVLIVALSSLSIYALKSDETSRFILFLGRFHPLLLHLPIGALVVTFFIDLMGRVQRNYPSSMIRNMLGFTSFFAIFTCYLGYFLSLEGGYLKETLNLHFYTGIATAVLSFVLFRISARSAARPSRMFLPVFILALVSISITGHLGSVLTHGDQFLTEYAEAPKKEKTIELVDSLKIYKDVIFKILDQKCVQCHNASKRKGELSLISQSQILKGGENGIAIEAGNATSSLLYTHLLLPISDEDHMPPEGKEQLTKDEIWLIKYWIDKGADFKGYVDNTAKNDSLRRLLEKYLVFNKIEIPKASINDIDELNSIGFRVFEIVPGQSELSVKCLKADPTKKQIETLSIIEEQIVELDFGSSTITDDMTNPIKGFKNLKTLRLNSRLITDKSIKNFKTLKHLEVLNIYNTQISNKGITELLNSIKPKQIYAWKTQIDEETSSKLTSDFAVKIHNGVQKGFVENSRLEMPLIRPEGTIFIDAINLKVESRLKNIDFRYTLNGDTPDSTSKKFIQNLVLRNSQTLKIAAFKQGWLPSKILVREYAKVKHTVSDFSLKAQPNENYPDANKLFDLKEGSTSFKDGSWIGYFGPDLVSTIDLGDLKTVENISFNCLEDVGSWILFPTAVIVYASETKNGKYSKIDEVTIPRKGEGGDPEIKKVTMSLTETKARYFKIQIKNHRVLPKWHPSAGNPSWLFVDEIYFW